MTSLSFQLLVTPKKIKIKINPYFSPKSSVDHKTPSILNWAKSDKQRSLRSFDCRRKFLLNPQVSLIQNLSPFIELNKSIQKISHQNQALMYEQNKAPLGRKSIQPWGVMFAIFLTCNSLVHFFHRSDLLTGSLCPQHGRGK